MSQFDKHPAQLFEMYRLLSIHPAFRAPEGGYEFRTGPKMFWLGRLIKEARLLRFGAEFAGGLTLLACQLQPQGAAALSLALQWYGPEIRREWSVFIHFLDQRGEILFQGDYPLARHRPDVLGFFYDRRAVQIPKEAPGGEYRIRLGVWSPSERIHLPLTRFRGCFRETPGWCHNAVLLDSLKL